MYINPLPIAFLTIRVSKLNTKHGEEIFVTPKIEIHADKREQSLTQLQRKLAASATEAL
jgi:hypothetical protein